jgi:hypothetical protein
MWRIRIKIEYYDNNDDDYKECQLRDETRIERMESFENTEYRERGRTQL